METKSFPSGTLIVKENDLSRKMYIIKSGKAVVFKTHFGKKITLATIGAGEIFGELSFLDAQPRSASVLAATDLEVFELDGLEVADKSKDLPKWVSVILKSVFHRFRELDHKLSSFQALGDTNGGPKNDEEAIQNIYKQLIKFNKMMSISIKSITSVDEHLVEKEILLNQMEDVLEGASFSVKGYLKALEEANILEVGDLNKKIFYTYHQDQIDAFNSYLQNEIDCSRFLLLSHSAIALLREIIGQCGEHSTSLDASEHQFSGNIPLYEESVQELVDLKILSVEETDEKEVFRFKFEAIREHYVFQKIIKTFDFRSNINS